jgi:hypothetical protein
VTEDLTNSQLNLLHFTLSKFTQLVEWLVMRKKLFQHRATGKLSRLRLTVAPLLSYGECKGSMHTMKWATTLLPTPYSIRFTL